MDFVRWEGIKKDGKGGEEDVTCVLYLARFVYKRGWILLRRRRCTVLDVRLFVICSVYFI